MATLDQVMRMLTSSRMPQSAQELEQAVQKEAMRRFYETLEMLSKYWLAAKDYHSEHGIAKLAQMKQLLDSSKEG